MMEENKAKPEMTGDNLQNGESQGNDTIFDNYDKSKQKESLTENESLDVTHDDNEEVESIVESRDVKEEISDEKESQNEGKTLSRSVSPHSQLRRKRREHPVFNDSIKKDEKDDDELVRRNSQSSDPSKRHEVKEDDGIIENGDEMDSSDSLEKIPHILRISSLSHLQNLVDSTQMHQFTQCKSLILNFEDCGDQIPSHSLEKFMGCFSDSHLIAISLIGLSVRFPADERSDVSEFLWSLLFSIPLSHIKELVISRCELTNLDMRVFSLCPVISSLDLSSNTISDFSSSLRIKTSLEKLILRKNSLAEIGDFLQYFSNLTLLDLRENPIQLMSDSLHAFLLSFQSCKVFLPAQTKKKIFNARRHLQQNETKSLSSEDPFVDENDIISRRPMDIAIEFETIRSRKKPREELSEKQSISLLYRNSDFVDFSESIVDGFIDCGRRQELNLDWKSLTDFDVDAREIIIVDKNSDARLRRLVRDAQNLLHGVTDDLLRIKLLALFVSDALGGRQDFHSNHDFPFKHRAELLFNSSKSNVLEWKLLSRSDAVPLGSITHGVCRHRAVLFKYLSDSFSPRIPSALVRGYRGGTPHVWNLVMIRGSPMILDCLDEPHSIRPLSSQAQSSHDWDSLFLPQFQTFIQGHASFSRVVTMADVGGSVGFGSNSSVHTCHLPIQGGLLCAVKITEMTNFTHSAVCRVFQELPLLSQLCHENIVRYFGYHIQDSFPKNVQLRVFLEFIHGCSLRQLIDKQKGPMELPDVIALALPISRGLSYLHRLGFIHRDVKSDNIMVSVSRALQFQQSADSLQKLNSVYSSRQVKICDLSNMVCMSSDSADLEIFGTLRWMAPEIVNCLDSNTLEVTCERIAVYTKKSDCYSFGVVLYEMLSGKLPFDGLGSDDLFSALISGQYLSEDLEESSQHLSSKNRETWELMRHLVKDCLSTDISYRPDMETISARLRDIAHTLIETSSV